MRKVLFRVDGNRRIGYGHVIRCVALAQYLKGHFSLSFACIGADDFVTDQFVGLGNLIQLESDFYVNRDLNSQRSENLFYDLEDLETDFDIFILDGYFFSDEYLLRLKKTGKQVVYIDDQYRLGIDCDLLINHLPDAPEKEDDYVNARIKLLGTPYALIRREFLEYKCQPFVGPTAVKLFIALGGTATAGLLNGLIRHLRGLGRPLHLSVLTAVEVEGADLVLQSLSPDRLAVHLCNADVCLITPGMISYEVFSVGRPAVMGTLSSFQTNILKTFDKQNLCYNIGCWHQVDAPSVEAALAGCVGKASNQGSWFDGLSGERILNKFLSL